MQRLGNIIPFGFVPRLLIRRMLNRPQDVRKAVGTFQISTLRQVDLFVPFLITANAVLGVGRVRDRVLVIDGKQEIRPTAIVLCCVDHKAWDGARAAKFMTALNDLLQSDELKSDCKSILKD